MLGLRPATISHHLGYLAHAGLVSGRVDGYYNVYELNVAVLHEMAQRLLTPGQLPLAAAGVDLEAYDRQVLENFALPDGRLKQLPMQRKKFEVILRHVVRVFRPGEKYTEKEVNELLGRFHPDTAALRRGLVDARMIVRDAAGRLYWLPEGANGHDA
jgi:hypothetical protein